MVSNIINKLDKEFGKETPITRNRGKIHDYLGMTLDFTSKGKVKVSMKDYIESIIEDLRGEMIGRAVTPAAPHLFQVCEVRRELLDKFDAERFHHYVAQLLFLSQHGRPDIWTALSFLSTRVKQPWMQMIPSKPNGGSMPRTSFTLQ
mmetsp:Transcript_15002/g.21701  ORF Transcript_15002/g.21701 Transcript_15002/m.21701 type:complete len:147 (-) Transcript_15002:412-852(-)